MSEQWTVLAEAAPSAPWVLIGTAGDSLPASFFAVVAYTDNPVQLDLELAYGGDRVEVRSLTIRHTAAATTITPTALARLRLAQIVWQACMAVVSPGYGLPGSAKRKDLELIDAVAAVYGFAHASWGDARRAVMTEFGMGRTNANTWVRRAAERHAVPGPHGSRDRHLLAEVYPRPDREYGWRVKVDGETALDSDWIKELCYKAKHAAQEGALMAMRIVQHDMTASPADYAPAQLRRVVATHLGVSIEAPARRRRAR